MRLFASALAVAGLLVVAIVQNAMAIDAEEIIRRHLEAKGGVEKLRNLKTLQMKGRIISGSMVGDIEVVKRAPSSFYSKVRTSRGITTHGCNGEFMWSTNPRTGFHRHEGDDYRKRLDQIVIEPLLGYKERGGRYAHIGIDDFGGDSCYKLLYIGATGDSAYTVFFDVHNYQMLGVETETPNGVMKQYFEDIRDVDGFLFPFVLKMEAGDQKQTTFYDEITVNKPVPDSLFVMPEPGSVPSIAKPIPDTVRNITPQRD